MRIVENIRMVIWVLSILCSLRFSLQFEPPDNYLIDCGSSSDVSVNDRKFVADGFNSSFLETPNDISVKNTSSIAISSTFGSALFETARIFNETSDYTFPIRKPGRHWIRLYFYPLVNKNYNLSMAKFSVSAQGFTLLRDHQIQNDTLVKEYSVNISSNSLVLTFTPSANSFAFINALEVVSQPDNLLPEEARTIGSQGRYRNLQTRALETVERVNMGNVAVPPQSDILGRLWVSDGSYLLRKSSVMFVSNEDAVEFTTGSLKEIAPSSVYGTATALNTSEAPMGYVNITWNFNVHPGFEYLIRFHFCDIVSISSTQNRLSKVYVNSWSVSRNFDLSNQTLNSFGTPYFIDVVEKVSNDPQLKVSIGPPSVDEQYPLVFLNGLEIMKVSDSRGGLDVSDSFKSSSKTKIAVIVGLSAGLFIAVVLAMLIFIVCRRRRKLALVGHSKTEDVAVIGMENNHVNRTGISGLKTGYRFPLSVIQEATDNFSENLVIGVGGFGKVYEGVLSDNTKVAVKRGVSESNQDWAMKWQRRGQLEEVVDPRIADQIKPDSLKKFGEIAEKCLAENSVFRPTMGDVLWNLEYVLQLQGVDKRRSRNDELSSPVDHLETGESTAEFSMGSMGDIAGVSMSKVFAQMMKEEIS
ncbi:hypothetical protein FEM48_Zijuj03G0080000 [Ziziphus jujuba var. spinosa]|uniref:Malectin-like domain-containing protein n=1 Tax=Ziziphus jujuba var. spinosa TaxID=714518 RepID=A0A978VP44_ZIZJJ|nr:hypothetical protein FEM48_Zijuj03G0080000 [Ziziphus jujuba var. spinosa]